MYECTELNSKGEKITIEIAECESCKERQKIGYPQKWLAVDTYIEDARGCWGRYNPFVKNKGTRQVVAFEKLLTPSAENVVKAIEMVEELAFS